MIRHASSTPSWRVKRESSPTIAAWSSTSYGSAPSPPSAANSMSSVIGPGSWHVGAVSVERQLHAGSGSNLITTWFGSASAVVAARSRGAAGS